ncbi:MAG TPA: M13 family metallopeptidase [Puia sp.]|nr:M13 family metallopeptidase [Puia sp.]
MRKSLCSSSLHAIAGISARAIRVLAIFAIVIFAISCNGSDRSATAEGKFIDTSAMDLSVKPGDNFYQYMNGRWLKKTKILPTQFGVGGFMDLYYKTQDTLHDLLNGLSTASNTPGSIEQKVGDLYASGMDSATIDKLGYTPVKPYLEKIAAIRDASGILNYVAEIQKENGSLLFNISIGADEKNSGKNITIFAQGGLGLPDRDYYFKKDSPTLAVVKAYHDYANKLFRLTGDDSIKAAAKVNLVYELEKQMAASHRTNVELRDPQSNYHKMAVKTLDKQMPTFVWTKTLAALDIRTDSINLKQPAFYAKLNELLRTASPESWKAYLEFHTLSLDAGMLSSDFFNAQFDYFYKALAGQQEMKPRWDRIVSGVDGNLGEALGQIYVKKYFSEQSKKRMLELVDNLQTAFDRRISQLDWMSDSTKAKAKDKLHAFLRKIGYPDKWRDYGKVTIDRNKFFEDMISCKKNEYQYQVSRVDKAVDRTEWAMTPPTINAYYNPSFNEIVFPAGILQPPFFSPDADDAINYGGIGMVIGHEMTHGFDDQGAQYDKDGNLKNWWSKEDSVKFVARTRAVIDQYNKYVAVDTFHVNGALTTGENIADLGGLTIAYDAFKLTAQGKDTTRIDGLTPDQRFFLSFANVWRSKYKDEIMRQLVNTDPHSPDMFRVLGPLENFTPFYNAFKIQQGDKMYKPENERLRIW